MESFELPQRTDLYIVVIGVFERNGKITISSHTVDLVRLVNLNMLTIIKTILGRGLVQIKRFERPEYV